MDLETTIILRDVGKKFGTRTLFSNLNCRVLSGECLTITGSNGSGKTTLLKIIARLIRPTAGRIEMAVGGSVLRDAEECIPYIGLVSPEIVFYDQLTGSENIELLAGARGLVLNPGQSEEALAAIGLEKKGWQKVKTYSTGMKQRLKFALLAAIDPSVWLIDEGLSNLDGAGREQILALIAKALERRRLLVLATNEQAEVAYASQTIPLS